MFKKRLWFFCLVLFLLITGSLQVGAAETEMVAQGVRIILQYTAVGDKNFYYGYEPIDSESNVNVVIVIPSGTTGKWKIAKKDGFIGWEFKKGKPHVVDFQGGYPANYGSVPRTYLPKKYGEDGDQLDVIVFGDALPRGKVVKVKLIGSLKIMDDGKFDDKLLAVYVGSPEYQVSNVDELNTRFNGIADRVASWFHNYKGPDSGVEFKGFGSVEEANDLLLETITTFDKNIEKLFTYAQ